MSGWRDGGGFTFREVVGMEGGGVGIFEVSRLCRFLLFYNPQTPFEGGFGRWRSYVWDDVSKKEKFLIVSS